MLDIRPVAFVIGLLLVALGAIMALPLLVDLAAGNGWSAHFAESAVLTVLVGGGVALATANSRTGGLTLQQAFLLTVVSWVFLPLFGALPFWLGPPEASFTDAFFETMSGMTTTGSTVFTALESLPHGILLWRSLLQWIGGIGIIVVALAFLPEMRVGGMQYFKSEAFDTLGKILPRAVDIAKQITTIYVALTLICAGLYVLAGMSGFDAINHSMTTLATGGFATKDDSMGSFGPGVQYVASLFMFLSALPFVRYIQLLAGTAAPLYRDAQVRFFAMFLAGVVLMLVLYRLVAQGVLSELSFREALFNATSIITGTGYASTDYQLWGGFAAMVFFVIGFVGGCTGSTACSIKVFRVQIMLSAIGAQIRRIHSPHGIFTPRFQGKPVEEDILSSIMAFVGMFFATLAISAVLLSTMGLDTVTAISGAATAVANIGPGLGTQIGPAGNFAALPDNAKWVLIITMLVGRLEIMAVFVLFTVGFWRR